MTRLFLLIIKLSFIVSLSVSIPTWASTPTESTFVDDLSGLEYAPNPTQDKHTTLIWLWSEHGPQASPKIYAQRLSDQGYRVWIPSLFESYFLPHVASSLDQIPKKTLLKLIQLAQKTAQNTLIITEDKTSALTLQTLAQIKKTTSHLGLILINPNLYTHTPEAGEKATYLPAVSQTHLPIYIFQSELSPWRWHLSELQHQLAQGQADVFVHLLPKVRDRFYFRPDALAYEQKVAQSFDQPLKIALNLLTPYMKHPKINQPKTNQPKTNNLADNLSKHAPKATQSRPKKSKVVSGQLMPYTGKQTLSISLKDLHGQRHTLNEYKGKVVLLNFWASWCPPCVHEMPSMANLKTHFNQQNFAILAVNLGEEKADIQTFIKQHPVNFPILLDTQGQAVQNWKIFAYPSSFLIDKNGTIRNSLFGGYEWDSDTAKKRINQLLREPNHD